MESMLSILQEKELTFIIKNTILKVKKSIQDLY